MQNLYQDRDETGVCTPGGVSRDLSVEVPATNSVLCTLEHLYKLLNIQI